MQNDWNPQLYTRFEGERTRPAAELLARIPDLPGSSPLVIDLGCGPGNSTELLACRFAGAPLAGVDNSPAMLDAARARLPGARFVLSGISDVQDWLAAIAGQGDGDAPALLFANAALQWVPDHAGLLPRLMEALCPGGVLAVQMPDNRDEDTHRLMREVAARPAYAPFTENATRAHTPLLGVHGYYDLLAPLSASVDIWHTIYQHPMDDAAAIVQWLGSTGLRPFVDGMPPDVKATFLADYALEIDRAYGVRGDGKRLMAFPRLFFVARKAA